MSKLIFSYLFKTTLAAFRSAVISDNTDKICRILDIEHAYINKYIDSEGNTALLLAIQYASPLTVRLLLEQGAQPDQPNEVNSRTPLGFIAARIYEDGNLYEIQRAIEMAKILLDYGAYIDKPSLCHYADDSNREFPGKETPLMIAVRKRNLPMISYLIERNANVNFVENKSKIRPIHLAINNGDDFVFDLLVNAGALTSIASVKNNSLLHWFCSVKENDHCETLLIRIIKEGSDLNGKNTNGVTPLMLAAKYNMVDTCRTLLKYGVNLDEYDNEGRQAIDLSVPGSICSELILHAVNLQKTKLDRNPPHQPITKIALRKRPGDANLEEINRPRISIKFSWNEEKTNAFSKPSIDHIHQRNKENTGAQNQFSWSKLLQTNQKRRLLKKFEKKNNVVQS